MDAPRYEKLTVGILIKREEGVYGTRGLGLFYDPTQNKEEIQYQTACAEYTEETIFGKLSRIGGNHKYPNVDPQMAADLYHRTLCIAGIKAEQPAEIPLRLGLEGKKGYIVRFPIEDLERGRSIFEFLSGMYYDYRHILTSFMNIERAKKQTSELSTIVTIGPAVSVLHAQRYKPIYIGGFEQIDSMTVDKTSVALEFYNVTKQQLRQCREKPKSEQAPSCIPFQGLLAHQVAYTHSVMWDSKDLPRGYRANFISRGLGGLKQSNIGVLAAYSLFPAEMEKRLVDSLYLLQNISIGPPELLRDLIAVNNLIRDVVPDDFYGDISFS